MEKMEAVPVSEEIIRNGLDLSERYQLSLWDAVIIAAAQSSHCDILVSGDFSAGQSYGGVTARNPFT